MLLISMIFNHLRFRSVTGVVFESENEVKEASDLMGDVTDLINLKGNFLGELPSGIPSDGLSFINPSESWIFDDEGE